MATTMDGLFGPSPYEIQQQRFGAQDELATKMAQMNAAQRSVYGAVKGGGMLGGIGAEAMGFVDPAVANAQRTETIMGQGDTDLSSSAGLLAKAEQFRKAGDLRTATALALKGNELKKQEDAAASQVKKDDLAERRFQEAELVKIADRKQAEADKLAAQIKTKEDALAQQERDGKRDDATRQMIANMNNALGYAQLEARKAAAEAKAASSGSAKPLTPAQQSKLDKTKAESSAAIRAQDSEIVSLGGDIDKAIANPNLSKATGVSSKFWSLPGGEASKVEGDLDSIANRLKAQGLKVLREGGGIGAITEKEWDILANQVANIDRTRGTEYVKGELEKVKLRMNEMKRNAAQRHYEQFGEEYSGSRDAQPTPTTPAAASGNRKFKVLGKE